MREYDNETLSKVQQLELMILRDSLALCKRHGLQMFGIAGTAIGAIRHGGFIPWDDDIDVALMRKDYDLFIKYVKEELGAKYIVMNAQEDSNYPLMTTRLMLKGTKFREEALQDIDCYLGIFLDIYVLDYLADDEKAFKKQCRDAFLISKLQILRSIPLPVLPFRGVKAKLAHVITWCAHYVLVIFCVSKKKLYQCGDSIARRFDDHTDAKRVGFLFDTFPYLNIYETEDIFPLRPITYNGIPFAIPCHVEKKLTEMYGDFMTMPPVEKRKNHFPFELDFGQYTDISTEDISLGKCDWQK